MKRPVVRLRDVAEAAGTSTKTASRVINGDTRVSAQTRARVEAAVEEMGYRVDVMARTLRRGTDDAIGVIVPTIGDPFFATALEEIERSAMERDIKLLVASNSAEPHTERAIVESMLARRVSGLIVVPFSADYGFLTTVRTPVVFMDRQPDALADGAVMVDDVAGASLIVDHLVRRGHRRIALLLDDLTVKTSQRRYDGYLRAHAESGLVVDQQIIFTGCHDAADGERHTRELLALDEPPTALLSGRSELSLGVVRALHLAGRTEIALVSFGDFANADLLSPGVTVLDHNARAIARAAVVRLFARIDGLDRSTDDIFVPLHLIERGSGELNPVVARAQVRS